MESTKFLAVALIVLLARTNVTTVAAALEVTINHAIDVNTNSDVEQATSKVNYMREHIFSGAIKGEQPEISNETDEVNYPPEPTKTFLDWYEDGVSAYLSEDWSGCVDNLLLAINGYRDYYSATASCRIKCANVARQVPPFFEDNVDDLHYYESVVRRTLCMVKCKRLLLPSIPEFFHMNQWSKDVFQTAKPYTYLQMCYFKVEIVFIYF